MLLKKKKKKYNTWDNATQDDGRRDGRLPANLLPLDCRQAGPPVEQSAQSRAAFARQLLPLPSASPYA